MRDLAFRSRVACLGVAGRASGRFVHLISDSFSYLARVRHRRRIPHGWCLQQAIHEQDFQAISQPLVCSEEGVLTAALPFDSKKGLFQPLFWFGDVGNTVLKKPGSLSPDSNRQNRVVRPTALFW